MKQWVKNMDPQLINTGLNMGLIPGDRSYTRFIILGRSRTGSNFLRGLLRNHPEVVSLGEILRNPNVIEWDNDLYQSTKKILKQYQEQPVSFVQDTVYRKFPKQVKAVGFKLFYYHAQEENQKQIWNYLKEEKNIHILHIKRKNILRTHLSRVQAIQSGSWVNIDGKKQKQVPVTLDPEECLADFQQTREWEKTYDSFFIDHPKKEIYYEDLAENYEPIIAELQSFLHLSPQPVEPQTYKQNVKPLSESIENYWELKSYFEATPWKSFFEE